jgi:hypothetical protein
MAAIINPSRLPAPPRPQLRLVHAAPGRPDEVPVGFAQELGLGARHVCAVAAALVAMILLVTAIGSGALASLAPAPVAGPATGAPERAAAASGAASVEVRAGDTLWVIARRLQPTGDVRPLVEQLVALNGTALLQPGDRVVVPG